MIEDETPRARTPFRECMKVLDELHAEDPQAVVVEGEKVPKELWHSRQMTGWLERLEPSPSELLQLAVRAQHLQRWEVPRSQYPEGRSGYLSWRRDQGKRAGKKVAALMREAGYPESEADRVARMVRKEGFKRDPEIQTVEDCACLVFLENYFSELARQVDRDHMLRIIRKTWPKLSPAAQAQALELPMDPERRKIVEQALST